MTLPSLLLGGFLFLVPYQLGLVVLEVFLDHLELLQFHRNTFLAQVSQMSVMAECFSDLNDFDVEISNLPELSYL